MSSSIFVLIVNFLDYDVSRFSLGHYNDALGRSLNKHTEPQVPYRSGAGSGWRDAERQRLKQECGYGLTLYGWDGDTLAYEMSWDQRKTTHYVYEPGSFTPLIQAKVPLVLHSVEDGALSSGAITSSCTITYYHCDQIGTPQEVTDESGDVAWSARYKAWGQAREVISDAARKAVITNRLRFAGQYFDAETGLHYNRHRYYDPNSGRFISKNPIGLEGGFNAYQYAPNPTGWIDPIGLARCPCDCLKKGNLNGKGPYRGGSYGGATASGIESHHMPANSVSPLTRSQGPAIQMIPEDHEKTMSHGYQGNAGKEYRAIVGNKLEEGDWRGAMAMEVRDVRRVAVQVGDPTKYNEAMREMLAYSKCRGFLNK